jgi:transposase
VLLCAAELFLCIQRQCPGCGIHKQEKSFYRSSICRECRSKSLTSTLNIAASIDPSSFLQFFNHEVTQGSRLSNFQRSSIVTLHQLNFSISHIAQLTGCDVRTIHHWINYYNEHQSLQDESRSGRSRVTTEDIDTSIVAAAIETPITTPRIIRAELGIEASTRTIRRRLDEAGLFGRVARIEYPFTEEHITQRLQFAQEHESWREDKWSRVLFGDETYICLGAHGQIWVQRPQDAAYLNQFMVQGQSNFTPKIGIWGCFTGQGVGELRIFDDNMDTRLYTDTMQQYMKPYALRFWPNGEWFYLHDNSSYHGSHRSREWFHNNGISLIELSPHSPDLNPIENLWEDLKRRIESRFPHTMQELKQIVTEEWTNTNQLICSNLVDSMPDRMRAVVTSNGFKTRY